MSETNRIRTILANSRMTICPACGGAHLNLGALDCPHCGRVLDVMAEISFDHLDNSGDLEHESFSGSITLEEGDLWS